MRRPTCVVMVKEPKPGRVKTRLGADLGLVEAAWWLRHRIRVLVRQLTDPRWALCLAVAPDRATGARCWPAGTRRIAQGPGDLGRRMLRIFARSGPGPVVIVGADIPELGPSHVAQAFARLGAHDAVLGPATDGGYWLIGFRPGSPAPARLFDGVRWSSAFALSDTVARLPGRRVALLEMLSDVDTGADLAAYRARSVRR